MIFAHPTGALAPVLEYFIAEPNLALLLVLAGIMLLYVEFNRPGMVVYAALGVFCLTLGGYALLEHPMSAFAIAVLPLGVGLTLLGLRFPVVGAVSIVTLTWALRHLLLVRRDGDPQINLQSAFLVSIAFVVTTVWLGLFALQARRNKRLPLRAVQAPDQHSIRTAITTRHPVPPARRVD